MKLSKSKKGFGLIETIVAAGIIAVASAGAITLANQVTNNTARLGQLIQAKELASQALETARAKRDSYYVDGLVETGWATFAGSTNQTQAKSLTQNGVTFNFTIDTTYSKTDDRTVEISSKATLDSDPTVTFSLSTVLTDNDWTMKGGR